MTTQTIAWEPTIPYHEDKITVREEIASTPYLSVLGTVPHPNRADEVRRILREAKATESEQGLARFGSQKIWIRAGHRAIWAQCWLKECGEPVEVVETAFKVDWKPKKIDDNAISSLLPCMAVLGTVPHIDRADEVRFIFQQAQADFSTQMLERFGSHERLTAASHRAQWAAAWLRELD